MGTGRSKLTAEVEVKGGKKGAADLKAVAGAQDQVTKAGSESTGKVQQAAEVQKKLNASTEDYTSLLSRVHPALGAMADGLVKGARVAGDFASQQINLRGSLGKATAAIKANANALKLIGAGGAVMAAIYMIVRAVQAMQQAYERVNATIKAHSDFLAENTRKQKAATQAFLDDAAARDKRTGDNVANLDKERNYVDRLIERYELQGDRAARARTTGQAIAGLDLTTEERKAAILGAAGGRQAFEIGPGVPESTAAARTRGFIGRPGTQAGIERITEQAEEQRRLRAEAAYRELVSAGGSRANLEEFLERRGIVTTPDEAKERAEQLQRIGVTSAEGLDDARRRHVKNAFNSETERNILGGAKAVKVLPEEEAQLRTALEALTRELRLNREGRGQPSAPPGISGGERPTIVIQNSRVTVPDSALSRGAVLNGQTYARQLEQEANPW